MLCSATHNPVNCEIRAVTRFLHAKIMSAAKTHRELYPVYGQNIVMIQRWADEQMFTVESDVVSRPSVVNDDLVQSVDKSICEGRRFTVLEVLCEYPETSRTALCEIITGRLFYHQFCARRCMSSQAADLTQAHKNLFPDMTSASIPAVT
jgi:hypothetical protein